MMNLSEIIFLLVILATMAGGATAVLSGSIIYAMVGLVTAMLGVAGLYIYLNSPFLAMMQMLIYVGAITVLIAFAIMLAGPLYRRPQEWTTLGKFGAALATALITLVIFVRFVKVTFPQLGAPSFNQGAREIGQIFFNDLLLPFELISLLVVVGILGAIMLSLFSRGKR
ncbi:MAG: NADH-quinone oxidoreductase subunit J [Deltaproteobacteria bacterium]|nr:NADH-quinone oxidoreductase subunit J [Deltaproteobacteria bacterium]